MKGKLVKRSNGRFDLYKIEDVDQLNTIGSSFDNSKEKLSLKNCQAIELGYDLDEEVSNIVKTIVPDDRGTDIWYGTSMAVGKLCFQKALEILGDKKFSEKDMIDILKEYINDPFIVYHYVENKLRPIQQTEWDVEILCLHTGNPEHTTNTGLPKLDEDGCLILKRL